MAVAAVHQGADGRALAAADSAANTSTVATTVCVAGTNIETLGHPHGRADRVCAADISADAQANAQTGA